MTSETEAALARLRDDITRPVYMGREPINAMGGKHDVATALAEIERLTNLADAERHRVEKLGEMVARLTDEKAAALAEIERLQADVRDYRETLDAWKKADRDDLRSARAAGYEAGQRTMREQAVAVCRQTQQSYLDPQYAGHPFHSVAERFAAGQCIGAVATLPILPEAQEPQS